MYQNYKHAVTGNVLRLPVSYGKVFPNVLIPTDEPEGPCTDCGQTVDAVEEYVYDYPESEDEIDL